MVDTAQKVLIQALEEGGYIKKERHSAGLFDAERSRISITTDLRYHLLFDPKDTGSTIDFVYEVPGQSPDLPGVPSIYFKALDHPSPEIIKELRSRVWNHGKAPTLWIATPESIRIYDGYARPQAYDDENSHLLEELKYIHGRLLLANEFQKISFDSGEFWSSLYAAKIKRQQRVDLAMLNDLTITEDLLIRELEILYKEQAISPSLCVSIAHALLGRTIFIAYLEDRGLLNSDFFQRSYRCESFRELLSNKQATYQFFHWLRATFNGDLFPIQESEEELITEPLLQLLQEFLSGSDMSSFTKDSKAIQRSFWPYKFDFIPVELISSIYEKFAHTRNSSAAEANSVHYTKLPLVELLLSLAMRNLEHTACVLDPACGSGVFLTEAFRRLAWKKSHTYGGQKIQRTELHDILRRQIFGIDIDRDAIYVTAFSLYLTLLELDPDPQPLEKLKFPPLLRHDPLSGLPPNLYAQDFCNIEHEFNNNEPFMSKSFDLIVGNPPWTALEPAKAPRDPDNPVHGPQWGLNYCIMHHIPDKKPDQAFLIRSQDFTHARTRVGFVVGSRLFYQQENPQWLHKLLDKITLETVVNLSDLVEEDVLFGGNSSTRLPASIVLFQATPPREGSQFLYLTPKWHPENTQSHEIRLTAEDVQNIPQTLVQDQPFLWKSAFRGTPRDYRLLNRIESLPSLGKILTQAGLRDPSDRRRDRAHRGVTFGKGQQSVVPTLQGKPFLAAGQITPFKLNVDKLQSFNRSVAKRSNKKFLDLPAVVLGRSIADSRQQIALAEPLNGKEHLVIDQMFYGIPFSKKYPTLVYQLNAILNSRLALYFAFMFSAALGWDRKLLEVGDWLQVPLPTSILEPLSSKLWPEILEYEQWLRTHWSQTARNDPNCQKYQNKLDEAVYQLYNLSEQEITLVEDTIHYGIKPLLSRSERLSNALARVTEEDLYKYALRICTQLDGVLAYAHLKLTPIIFFEEQHPSPIQLCRFVQQQTDPDSQTNIVRFLATNDIEFILKQIAESLRNEIVDHLYIQRNLRVYDETGFWIIKDSQKSLWTETAALNDADTVLYEHLAAMEEEEDIVQ